MRIHEGPYNPELMAMLDDFIDWFYSIDRTRIKVNGKPDTDEFYTNLEHLEESKKIPIHERGGEGYPKTVHGIDMLMALAPPDYMSRFRDISNDLNQWFGSKYCAVQMYYPQNGFMDWHNNGNAPGYNILLSHSSNGGGFFRWQDPVTEEIHTVFDKPGWNLKTGYYGRHDEPDKSVWHCARTYDSERITFGYVIPDINMWQMMIDDILSVE